MLHIFLVGTCILDLTCLIDFDLCVGGTWVFEFAVKFYPPEPSHLSEDVTR